MIRDYVQITKDEFYRRGGFSNPHCLRVTRSGRFVYLIKFG